MILFSCSLPSPTLILKEDNGAYLQEGDMLSLQGLVASGTSPDDISWSVESGNVAIHDGSLSILSDDDFSFVLTARLKGNPSISASRAFRVQKKRFSNPLFPVESLSLRENETVPLPVTLESAPNTEVVLTLSSQGDISFSPERLVFDPGNYATAQTITITGIHDESLEDKDGTLFLTTEKGNATSFPIIVSNIDGQSYGALATDTDHLSVHEGGSATLKVRLSAEPSLTQRVTVRGNGNVTVSPSFLDYTTTLYGQWQEVTVRATGIGEEASLTLETSGDSKRIPVTITDTEKRDESFAPTDIEYIKSKDYLVLYYDVGYHIDRLFVNLHADKNPDSWIDIASVPHCSFTNTCAFIDLTDMGTYDGNAVVRLKAEHQKRQDIWEREPSFTVEGYKVKATLGNYHEYFALSATPSTKTTNGEENAYRTFQKGNTTLYLTLRGNSQSRFRLSGLAPTSFGKIIETSQKKGVYYYGKLNVFYAEDHDFSDTRFRITEDENDNGFDWKAIVDDAVETFNTCLADIGAHISVTDDPECRNVVTYGNVPGGWGGLCVYRRSDGFFHVYVNSDPTGLRNETMVKGTTVHEFGHLMGLADNAYAINESLMCYSRDPERVTFFQPSDIAKLKHWHGIPQERTTTSGGEEMSVLFDYPFYQDRDAAADIIAEGIIQHAGEMTIPLADIALPCNLYRLRDATLSKGLAPTGDILFMTDGNTVLADGRRVRVYLRKFAGTPLSLINVDQGVMEL